MDRAVQSWRQGDVLLVKMDELPQDVQQQPDTVVAHGEATGHSHRFEIGAERFLTPASVQYVRVNSDWADLVHEEHGTIRLNRGVYRIVIQREYRPEGVALVID